MVTSQKSVKIDGVFLFVFLIYISLEVHSRGTKWEAMLPEGQIRVMKAQPARACAKHLVSIYKNYIMLCFLFLCIFQHCFKHSFTGIGKL